MSARRGSAAMVEKLMLSVMLLLAPLKAQARSRYAAAVLALLLISGLAPGAAEAATVGVSPSSVTAGGTVTVSWSGIANPTSTDWVALYHTGGSEGAWWNSAYTNGAASGSMPFEIEAHLAGGTYQFRLFANDGYTLLATSSAFTVVAGAQSTTLSASPSSLAPGGTLTASWQRVVSPTTSDWIAIFTPSAPDGTYVGRVQTDASVTGSRTMVLPANLAPGTYQLRRFWNDTDLRVATSANFTVTGTPPTTPTVTVSPATVTAGASVYVTWGGIANPTPTDWVALYHTGASDGAWWYSAYTTGASSGTMAFEIASHLAAGTYEFRFFTSDSYNKVATSSPFTVTAGAQSTTLTSTPATVAPGGTITASWQRVVSPTTSDWIAIFTPSAPDGTYVGRVQTDASVTGSRTMVVPATLAPGTYQLRRFWNDTDLRVATSPNFTVGTATTAMYFIHSDHLNTPRVITNSAGTPVWRWDNLDPFGANAANENPSALGTFICNLRLPGQYFDQETNLHYNLARDYDPAIGRYVQSDPIGLKGGINTYGYAYQNPLSYIDPEGLASDDPLGGRSGRPPLGIPDVSSEARDRLVRQLTGMLKEIAQRICPDREPCVPPEGTQCYEGPDYGRPHAGVSPHYHLYEMQRKRSDGTCFWRYLGGKRGWAATPPPGMLPCISYPNFTGRGS